MMNYLTMMPNFAYAPQLQPSSYAALTSQTEIKSYSNAILLNSLSQALTISLKNYQQQLTQNAMVAQKDHSQPLPVKEKTKNPQKVIEIIISEEEDGENLEADLSEQSNKTAPKTPLLTEKTNNITVQVLTDDENVLESKDSLNKKSSEVKKNCRNVRRENKSNKVQVMVPEVDLIQTAYLQQREITPESLAKKREQLMSRRVGGWNVFSRCRKERRQIRMLGN